MDPALAALLDDVADRIDRGAGKLVILTGAGLSADSGLPTFRGPEGYWTVGSTNYHPEEIVTRKAWDKVPDQVWRFCALLLRAAAENTPNAGHRAIAELDRHLGDRCVTITQNVDGYHFQAGNHPDRVFTIHGDGRYVRCGADCSLELLPAPSSPFTDAFDPLADPALRCPKCGALLRPHGLFFDESYNEPLYRCESALAAAREAALLLVVGTAGKTTLPCMIADEAATAGAAVVDVNPNDNPFAGLIGIMQRGHWVRDTAAVALPPIAARLIAGTRPA